MLSLRISKLAHDFDGRRGLAPVDVEFAGGCLAVVGPNGSGKSTLLRILAGLLTPTSGASELVMDGSPVPRACLRDVVGLAAPGIELYDELTVRENLSFLARCRGLAARRVDAAIDDVGLADRADDPVRELSSGMRRRACLASAILHEPRLLLLDEPGANLDEDGAQMLRAIVGRGRERGIVVLATNDPGEARVGDARIDLGAR